MTNEEFEILADPEFRAMVREFESHSPESLALSKKIAGKFPPHLLATQVNLRQKAKQKLPTWYAAGCVFTSMALEQATNETVAKLKQKEKGESCLDLTCGLGVDAWNFSRQFSKVTALEPDSILVKLARLNFSLLGANNIEVIQTKAEDFNSQFNFDLIYADPSRRDLNNNRNFLPEQGLPNIPELLPALLKLSDKILVKNSPLLDITAASGYLFIRNISVLGTEGECKEILLEFGNSTTTSIHKTAAFYFKNQEVYFSSAEKQAPLKNEYPSGGYILEADVTIYKAELAREFFGEINLEGWMQNPQGYFFSNEIRENIPAKIFKIIRPIPFKPATWKKELAKEGIEKILLTKRGLLVPLDQIRKEMKLKEGGEFYLVLTGKSAYLCERMN